MRYLALCCDYDGTLAHHGRVDEATIAALERARESGRRLVMVTGRELDDLQRVFERFDLFDYIVAENGALLYCPESREETPLADLPPAAFIDALRSRGVDPLSVGRVIVATWEPLDKIVFETIRAHGLDLQVIFNKGAVMVLPSGVNKATGLKAALAKMNLSPHNAVGVGDAENDHAFLSLCECSAAVANALPAVKDTADIVTGADHGAGVAQLIDELIANDLAERDAALKRHHILLGTGEDDAPLQLPAHGCIALVAGVSGGGKSTVALGLIERLHDAGYGFCVIDPEGDYGGLDFAVDLGGPEHPPTLDECAQLLAKPDTNAVINLLGIGLKDRPRFFEGLLARLADIRIRSGRPHWLIVDEAHHVLPETDAEPAAALIGERLASTLLITVRPNLVPTPLLRRTDTLILLGGELRELLGEFAAAAGLRAPAGTADAVDTGEALVWRTQQPPVRVRLEPNHLSHRRHVRKYAEGELPPDLSFYFRGPENKLKLRAPNLMLFLDLADGVDDNTWLFHLQRGDVSQWLRTVVKDEALTDAIAAIEQDGSLDARASRQQVREAVEARYTLPAANPGGAD